MRVGGLLGDPGGSRRGSGGMLPQKILTSTCRRLGLEIRFADFWASKLAKVMTKYCI